MVTFEHILGLPNVNSCCKALENLKPEELEVPQEGLTMVRCKMCGSRHFNQIADSMEMKATPTP